MKRHAAMLWCLCLAGCATVAPSRLDRYEIVDCELPGAVLRIGTAYATTARGTALRTSADDCAIRGGYYTTEDSANYQTSLRVWLPPADAGDAKAQYLVGQIYEKGLGQPADYVRATEWYRKAAEQNNPAAMTALAMLEEKGLASGTPQPMAALALYRQASGIKEKLAFASDVELRDREIETLKAELERARAEAERQSTVLRRQSKALSGQVDQLRQALGAARSDSARARAQAELAAREADAARATNALAATELDVSRARAALGDLTSASRDTPETDAPRIELMQPQAIAMRGLLTVRTRGAAGSVEVVARVHAKAAVMNMTINAEAVVPDAEGVVRREIALVGNTTLVEIVATDVNGRRSSLPFVLASERVLPPARPSGPREGFGNYYALVIGNARYRDWESLDTPHQDAEAVATLLEHRYGFRVTRLTDATRSDIFRALATLRASLTENDNLLVYYSGHGSWDQANLQGYWIPVDGARDGIANYISSSDITDQIGVMRAKQVLVVADACYSGVFVRSVAQQLDQPAEGDRDNWLMSRAQLRSRKVMSSGNVRAVLDGGGGEHSVFARQFIDALGKRAQPFEAQEIYREIAPQVAQAAQGYGEQQEPQYGLLRYAGHVGGDFVFVPRLQ